MDFIGFYPDSFSGIECVLVQQAHHGYPGHTHNTVYTVTLVLAGTIEYIQRSISCHLSARQTMITPPDCFHSIKTVTPFYDLFSLCIPTGMVECYSTTKIQSACLDAIEHSQLNKLLHPDDIERLLADIVTISMQHRQSIYPASSSALRAIKQRILLYPGQAYSLSDLASETHLSGGRFIKAFARSFGLSPHQFLLQSQIRQAKQLLQMGATMADVACQAGFYDQSHFIRHFKKRLGITPGHYRIACFS